MKQWIVYVHIFPNTKKYFGITSKTPNGRWEGGSGYGNNQPVMKAAIEKYGWENIEHIILFKDLTHEEAVQKEIELIAKYKTNCKKYGNAYGYNMTDGGEGTTGHVCSKEARKKMSDKRIGKYSGANNYKSKPIISDIGEWVSLTDFCRQYKYVRRTVEKWLYGLSAMPVEWYNVHLQFKNETHNITCQQKKWKNTIYYDGQIFDSQVAFAKFIGKYPSEVCRWIKTNSIPEEYLKKGFSINKPIND